MKNFYRSLYLTQRCYFGFLAIVVLYVFAFFFKMLMWPAFVFSMLFLAAVLIDLLLVYSKKTAIAVTRKIPEKLSNGDDNEVQLLLKSAYSFVVNIRVVDELPVQFQERNFLLKYIVKPHETKTVSYILKPLTRGEYTFGFIHVFVTTILKLVERKVEINATHTIPCYPSFIQLRKFQLMAASNKLAEMGVKQIRKIGHSMEFENIKEYVPGDDYRTVNWKAAARRGGTLMVNNYTDERSQPVYCIINSGRVMKMPFEGLSLLDYAINAALVLSNVSLLKQDKAGLITYGDRWLNLIPAQRSSGQMNAILYRLYNLDTNFLESNIEKLYSTISARITQRSLLIYFTNYESIQAVERDLPYLRMLNKKHLLLVVFFENTELKRIADEPAPGIEKAYRKIIAEKFIFEKRFIVKELQKHGILSILTSPQNLTVNVINKYLEVKARQMF